MATTLTAADRILVTGAGGFLAAHVTPELARAFPDCALTTVDRRDYDLLREAEVERMFRERRPTVVVHLAARVGGIMANRDRPADFCRENLLSQTFVFEHARRAGVRKLVTFMGGCSYPADAASPIDEGQFWRGYPQAESAAYATAKMMQLVLSRAYRSQHGLNSVVLVPGNVYGEHDNFNLHEAHVVPALIRRFVEAREQDAPAVVLLGSGRPTRDFVYAGDVARLVPWFITAYDSSDPVNISTQTETSIRDLAAAVRRLTGYGGEIRWDAGRPDGQMRKVFSTARLHGLGLGCTTPLESGLRRTIEWFEARRRQPGVRL